MNISLENSGGGLGIAIIVLGVLLAAHSGTGLLREFALVAPPAAASPAASPETAVPFSYRCPEEQLRLENLSVASCHLMAARVGAYLQARPDWFRGLQIPLLALSLLLACVSIYAGLALVDFRPWAPLAALGVLAALLLVDLAQFAAAAAAGALMRELYLGPALLWLVGHALLGVALWVFGVSKWSADGGGR